MRRRLLGGSFLRRARFRFIGRLLDRYFGHIVERHLVEHSQFGFDLIGYRAATIAVDRLCIHRFVGIGEEFANALTPRFIEELSAFLEVFVQADGIFFNLICRHNATYAS